MEYRLLYLGQLIFQQVAFNAIESQIVSRIQPIFLAKLTQLETSLSGSGSSDRRSLFNNFVLAFRIDFSLAFELEQAWAKTVKEERKIGSNFMIQNRMRK
jgi:hypothetical protein